MSLPTVNALAPNERLSWVAAGPVCTRTLAKSAPIAGSTRAAEVGRKGDSSAACPVHRRLVRGLDVAAGGADRCRLVPRDPDAA